MKTHTPFLTLCLLVSGILQLHAQIGTYTQFFNVPLMLNPALAGSDCGPRFTAVYHLEDSKFSYIGADSRAFSTSFDLPFQLKNGDRIGAGARWDFLQTTPVTFQSWVGGLSLSFQKKIFKGSKHTHYFAAGMDGGLAGRSLDTMASRKHNPFIPHIRDHFFFSDFSGGFLYQLAFKSGDKIVAGVTATHLGRPKQLSFYFDHGYPLDVRYQLHGNAEIGIFPHLGLSPWAAYYFWQSVNWANIGCDIDVFFDRNKKKSLGLGAGFIGVDYFTSDSFVRWLVFGGELNWNRFSLRGTYGIDIKWDDAPKIIEASFIYRYCK